MNLLNRKTYVLKFKNKEHYIQFSIELKNNIYKSISYKAYQFKGKYIYILKIPEKHNKIIPHIKEYGFFKPINKLDEAYIKEYGKAIMP